MPTFVLVHGAFGSPAELAPVIPELEALGHRAIAIDLPSTDPAALLEDYARTVVEAMTGIEGRSWSSVTPQVARRSRSCPSWPASIAASSRPPDACAPSRDTGGADDQRLGVLEAIEPECR